MQMYVQGLPVKLKEFHDLSWLDELGQVFEVFDQMTGGSLGFGVLQKEETLYVKYAGASPVNYLGKPEAAVDQLRRAASHYAAIQHPALVRLRFSREMPEGYLCAFQWEGAAALAPMPDALRRLLQAPVLDRLQMMDTLLDLHVLTEARGLAIAGLADSHLLYDAAGVRLILCSLDQYLSIPARNTRGRLPGSPYYLAPECYQLGAGIDETTSVYALGMLAFLLFGDRLQPARQTWQVSSTLYDVAAQAIQTDRNKRFQSTAELQEAWRSAVHLSPWA
jgi:serine/threonine-protein kinase